MSFYNFPEKKLFSLSASQEVKIRELATVKVEASRLKMKPSGSFVYDLLLQNYPFAQWCIVKNLNLHKVATRQI